MGCVNSTNTAVQPLKADEVNGDEDKMESKLSGRGDSAVSKATTDSGVVMENSETPGEIPGAVPRTLPPLTSESIRESEVARITQEDMLLRYSEVTERQKSSVILEELLNQGIITKEQPREKGSRAGEAYSITLDDGEGVRRRPPARLESLKVKKAQCVHSREALEKKIRLAAERRKLKENELKMRLRTKSACVRVPCTASTAEDEDTPLTPLPPRHPRWTREDAEGGEWVREDRGDGRECEEEVKKVGKRERREEEVDHREEGIEREGEEEEEVTKVSSFTALAELESDFSFQHAEDKEEVF
ncbi:stathmin domain-containing protein 1 [Archocentrus centrarchus]|uniref:stathmin domain-containing protein 1 n=1 Tax=Archocentrus centrarchus TaxID=63155 RepID=UPI0011EA0498|nr:stathmin domain-containing protein 1 [Archocentrus centrarchus]